MRSFHDNGIYPTTVGTEVVGSDGVSYGSDYSYATVQIHRTNPVSDSVDTSTLYDYLGYSGNFHDISCSDEYARYVSEWVSSGYLTVDPSGLMYSPGLTEHSIPRSIPSHVRESYFRFLDPDTLLAYKNDMPIDARGIRTLYLSLNGVSRGGFSITNFNGTVDGSEGLTESVDEHVFLNVPVNAPYGGVIQKTYDDVYANALNQGLTRELQSHLKLSIYDERMNLLNLDRQTVLNLTLKKYGNNSI
tara:strand:- start:643 stop:1380 length:738 start_codon:yes stop_codon:yes gene_type:complete